MQQTYPNLLRFVAVNDPDEKSMHIDLGMRPRLISTPMDAIALAGDILTAVGTPEDRVMHWMETEIERFERDNSSVEAAEEIKKENEAA